MIIRYRERSGWESPTRHTLIFVLLVLELNGDWKEVLPALIGVAGVLFVWEWGVCVRCGECTQVRDRFGSGCPVWSLVDEAYSYGHLKGKAFRHGDIVGMFICTLREVLSLAIGRGLGRLVQAPWCEGWNVWQPHRETQVFAYGYQEDLFWVGLVL